MLIDITKCIGCGSCVRACEMENDVPEGYFRTWVERYHVSDWHIENPEVDSPNGGMDGFPPGKAEGARTSSCPRCATTASIRLAPRCAPLAPPFIRPDGVGARRLRLCLGCRYCIQACPYGCRFFHPKKHTPINARSVITASRRPDHCLLRSMPHGRAAIGRLEESQRSDSRLSEDALSASLEAASRDGLEAVYNSLDGSVRKEEEVMKIHVSNEVELQWGHPHCSLSFSHRSGRRCLHPGVSRAGVSRGGSEANVPAFLAYGAGFPDRCPASLQLHLGHPERSLEMYLTPHRSSAYGDVRICLSLVSDAVWWWNLAWITAATSCAWRSSRGVKGLSTAHSLLVRITSVPPRCESMTAWDGLIPSSAYLPHFFCTVTSALFSGR